MQPRIHKADEGRAMNILGSLTLEKAASTDLGGSAAVFVQIVKPAGGPPTHVHLDTDEFVYVLEGELEVWIGARHVTLSKGMSATLPRGLAHRFDNHGMRPVSVLTVVTPGRGARFFDDIDRERPELPADIDKLRAIVKWHGIHFVA
jgi:mannose-6-phosphate isomerase-like protein (cupin superfamily)